MKLKNNDTPSLITKDEKYINHPVSIGDTFNNFFTFVVEIVHSKIKFLNKSFRNFLSSEINDSFMITLQIKKKYGTNAFAASAIASCNFFQKEFPSKNLRQISYSQLKVLIKNYFFNSYNQISI